jgi:hypothetical protein
LALWCRPKTNAQLEASKKIILEEALKNGIAIAEEKAHRLQKEIRGA